MAHSAQCKNLHAKKKERAKVGGWKLRRYIQRQFFFINVPRYEDTIPAEVKGRDLGSGEQGHIHIFGIVECKRRQCRDG